MPRLGAVSGSMYGVGVIYARGERALWISVR